MVAHYIACASLEKKKSRHCGWVVKKCLQLSRVERQSICKDARSRFHTGHLHAHANVHELLSVVTAWHVVTGRQYSISHLDA